MSTSTDYKLDQDVSKGTKSIEISGYRISSTKLPILTIPQSDHASQELDLDLPEIIFGNNRLTVEHLESGFTLDWNAIDMLRDVQKGDGWDERDGSGAVRVAHSDEWIRGQSSTNSIAVGSTKSNNSTTGSSASNSIKIDDLKVQKPFDWTYTTLNPGRTILPSPPTSFTPNSTSPRQRQSTTPNDDSSPWQLAPSSHPGIPFHLLARTDVPILFFDEVPLFEDELGDNGIAEVTVRVRVNSTSFYLLSRYSLRIDHVLFRHFDVRVYHEFGTKEVLREVKGFEEGYERVRERLGGGSVGGGGGGGGGGRGGGRGGVASIPNRQLPITTLPTPQRSPFSSSASKQTTSSSTSTGMVEDLTKLTDVNWVNQQLEQIDLQRRMSNTTLVDGNDGGRGENEGTDGGRNEWKGKGRRLEILTIDW